MPNRYFYYLIGFLFILLAILVGGLYALRRTGAPAEVASYDDCVRAGYPVMESYPPRCRAGDGRTFVGSSSPAGTASSSGSQDISLGGGAAAAPGTLEGQVTIGPICPVQRADEPCPPSPEMFRSQVITVYYPDGRVASTTHPSSVGFYRFVLPPGEYVIDTARSLVGSGRGTPTSFRIAPNRTVALDIDLDTGIR